MDDDKNGAAEIVPFEGTRRTQTADMPFARAKTTNALPIAADELKELVAKFIGTTVGQRFFGPSWVGDDGVPCIVFIAHDPDAVKRVRRAGACAAVGWRWNSSPSTLFSLTVMTRAQNPRPHVRWMRAGTDAVVVTLRQKGRFLMTVATPDGQHSGWMEADLYAGMNSDTPSSSAMDAQWKFPTPGIPRSDVHERFDPFCLDGVASRDERVEIPLWPDASSDVWAELTYQGPWADDLHAKDRARAAWGRQALRNRGRAAGFVQAILDRQALDGVRPVVDADGMWLKPGPLQERAITLVKRAPLIGRWLAEMAGPEPSAQAAYEACFAVLNNPYSLFCLLDKLMPILLDAADDVLAEAAKGTFEAALLDARITKSGSHRPWMANTSDYGLEMKAAAIDMEAPLGDIEELWRSGLEIIDLLDAGLRLTPHDFPVPLADICESLRNVALEGSYDEAEAAIERMLREAQEARQWSIPWGARVEVAFGPFVAARIFETNGEFSCHFLDSSERYHHVAIGITGDPPRAVSAHLIRPSDDDGEAVWNSDAELSLKLIAAAIVRDFLVVEERERLFNVRPMRRRIRGRDVRTVIYLPRVRYSAPHSDRLAVGEMSAGRPKHSVAPHLRRSGTASAAQRFLAQRYGMHIPEGFTFVRPHERGRAGDEERIRIYRSRSASRMIFDEVSTAPAGSRPAWFDFEKDCLRLLTRRGLRVVHQSANRDGDGGVDLYAVGEDNQSWIAQCKCWAQHRTVGPEVVRELYGAIALADKGASSKSRGILITTSGFSSGAIAAAAEFGFELIDGVRFTSLLKDGD
ncbi:restriction endonuclease [Burkholderia ubonensis]|uniref:restriction endonuclease n=1 Tax=Burkholderia ubonensis TaxID=101571 RepID=UPI000753D3A0|nr:restriction endonuclease [Burkholderia ubonensis]KVD58771.1 restriction endonuclease [Burkholderia ubonensis]